MNEQEDAKGEKVKELERLQKALKHDTWSTYKLEADRIREKAGITDNTITDPLLQIHDIAKFNAKGFSISADSMNGQDIQTFRRHDYYKGFYRCATLTLVKKWVKIKPNLKAEYSKYSPYHDPENPLSLEFNGRRVGALFTFAALCAEHKLEWYVRLDEEPWGLGDIDNACHFGFNDCGDEAFWSGVFGAKVQMQAKFKKMLEEEV